ncbi:hypothetical protein L0F63_005691 [Massospora cicadina]|nr:hypothetical protein L0F63_005691 [Massospora cicadina]
MSEESQKVRAEGRSNLARDTNIGLTHLWNLGHRALTIHPGLAGYYMSQFQKRSILADTNVQAKIRSNFCQACGAIFIPGVTCTIKLERDARPAQRSQGSTATACFKPRTYNFKASFNGERSLSGYDSSTRAAGTPKSNRLKFSCSLCQAVTLVAVPKKPKGEGAVCTNQQPTDPNFSLAKQEKEDPSRFKDSQTSEPGKASTKICNPDAAAKASIPDKYVPTGKRLKQTFQPKAPVKKKGSKPLNLAKILENEKRAKEGPPSKPQGFSLDDFLKGFK